ncbi:MAG: hypothetical protein GF307_07605 [candidate division Zixibacteria bacterium]|nr:hypothetical protein [candidate division Zixibacteria bacterium]
MDSSESKTCPDFNSGQDGCWLTKVMRGERPISLDDLKSDRLDYCKNCPDLELARSRAFGRRKADIAMSHLVNNLFDQVFSFQSRLMDTSTNLRKRVEELTILKKVTDHLLKTNNLEKALAIVLTGVTSGEAFGFNRAAVFLRDHRSKALRGIAAIGSTDRGEAGRIWAQFNSKHPTFDEMLDEIQNSEDVFRDSYCQAIREVTIPLVNFHNSLIEVLKTRKPFLCTPGMDVSRICPELEELVDPSGFVAVPIATESFEFGVLIADNFVTRIPVGNDDITALETFANTTASALEKIWLHNELRFKLRELEHAHNLLRDNQSYLVQHERLADIGKLATTVTHEIKTPLVTIGAYTKRLLTTFGTSRFRKEHLEVILNEVKRLERISNEILDYSRETKLDLKDCDLRSIVNDTLTLIIQQLKDSNISLKTRFTQDNLPVKVDANRIRQVLYNFVQNSIEEMQGGGTLIIRTRAEGKFAVMDVEDTGKGIPDNIRQKLFTPFFSTKAKGSGLGLPVSKKIIDDHGGYVKVITRQGVGTRFSVYLPGRDKDSN